MRWGVVPSSTGGRSRHPSTGSPYHLGSAYGTVCNEKVLKALPCCGLCSERMRLGYARCSTDEQADALTAQVARLEAAGCEQIVQELERGGNDDRPGLAEVLFLVRSGHVSELLITRADRLGRHAAFADELLALCAMSDVTVRALDGGTIEAATPNGFFQARLLTTLAEFESRLLSQRVKRQFEVYRTLGRHLRRRKPFGYQGGADYKLEPHPEQWPQALRVIERLRELRSFTAVARELPEWCEWTPAQSNLQAWFCNPVIRGHIGHNWDRSSGKGWNQRWGQILYDQHPALISETDWQGLAQDLQRTLNRFGGPGQPAKHGLSGLLRCAACGLTLRRNSSKGVPWWSCRHRLCDDRGRIREDRALEIVIKECLATAAQWAAMYATPEAVDPAVAAKRRDLEQLEALAARNPAVKSACDALRSEIESMSRRPRATPDVLRITAHINDPEFFSGATGEEQRALFGQVLQELQVDRAGAAHALPRSW